MLNRVASLGLELLANLFWRVEGLEIQSDHDQGTGFSLGGSGQLIAECLDISTMSDTGDDGRLWPSKECLDDAQPNPFGDGQTLKLGIMRGTAGRRLPRFPPVTT